MILTEQERKEFEEAVRPLMKWIGENCHPHVTAEVNCVNASLYEGICSFNTDEYIKD